MKEEILYLLRKSDTAEEREFNIHNVIEQGEAIDTIKHYEEVIKMGKKKTIRYEAIQGQMLRSLKIKKNLLRMQD